MNVLAGNGVGRRDARIGSLYPGRGVDAQQATPHVHLGDPLTHAKPEKRRGQRRSGSLRRLTEFRGPRHPLTIFSRTPCPLPPLRLWNEHNLFTWLWTVSPTYSLALCVPGRPSETEGARGQAQPPSRVRGEGATSRHFIPCIFAAFVGGNQTLLWCFPPTGNGPRTHPVCPPPEKGVEQR